MEVPVRVFTRVPQPIDRAKSVEHLPTTARHVRSFTDQYEQLLWTDVYRPKSSTAYLGNHTRQVCRLNEWFAHWTKRLQNEQPKQLTGKKRKRAALDDGDVSDDNSSKSISQSDLPVDVRVDSTRLLIGWMSVTSTENRSQSVLGIDARQGLDDRESNESSGYNEQTVTVLARITRTSCVLVGTSENSAGHAKPEHPQLIFIHGTGTTSLVHALAEEYNFKVTFEIRTNSSRHPCSL